MGWTHSNNIAPASVSFTSSQLRSKSSSPRLFSRFLTCLLTALCVTDNTWLALVKLFWRATASKNHNVWSGTNGWFFNEMSLFAAVKNDTPCTCYLLTFTPLNNNSSNIPASNSKPATKYSPADKLPVRVFSQPIM